MVRHKKHHGLRLRSLFLWHRYFGLAAAAFVLLLAVTGLLLNHGDELHLDQREVRADWLLNWYGLTAPEVTAAYPAGGHWISQAGERIYWDTRALPGLRAPLRGALATEAGVLAAAGGHMLLLTPEGELIEELGAAQGAPTDVEALGLLEGRAAARTAEGVYLGDAELFTWETHEGAGVEWAAAAPPPADLREELARAHRGAGLSMERVLLDLHSGRLFGAYGVMLMDAAALLMLLLAVTGVWHWARRKRR